MVIERYRVNSSQFVRRLRELARDVAFDAEPTALEYFSHDIAGPSAASAIVIARPSNVDALRALVRAATQMGCALVPRGAGFSYSGGYAPSAPGAVLVDLVRLDRIVEINEPARFVRVEAGCTWASLFEALAARGLRTPFFGPLSGYQSTVGGALSQGAAFFGSADNGFSDRSVLGLEVVLADGSLLRTGTSPDGRAHPHPSGPITTGIFLGDCGAFGVKAVITLRLIPQPRETGFASFAFENASDLLRVQTALANFPGLAECFGFDTQAHRNMARTGFDVLEGAQIAADVARGASRVGQRIKGLGALFRNGRRFVRGLKYSLHCVVEGDTEPALTDRLATISALALEQSGQPIPDTIPRVTRSRPFRPIKALLGPDGENWLPIHGVFRLDEAGPAWDALHDSLETQRAFCEKHGIAISTLTVLAGEALLIEPQLFWRDRLSPFHLRHVSRAQRERFSSMAPNADARAAAHELRALLGDTLRSAGAEHLQIGRYYPYLERLHPTERTLLLAVKATLDPKGLMNPGVLQMGGSQR